jgi:hypothetical protein
LENKMATHKRKAHTRKPRKSWQASIKVKSTTVKNPRRKRK